MEFQTFIVEIATDRELSCRDVHSMFKWFSGATHIKKLKGGLIVDMVNQAEMESFLNDKSAVKSDIVEITADAILEQKEDPQTKRTYKVLNVPVKVNGKLLLTYTPDRDAQEIMFSKWGKDTKSWIGHKFQVDFVQKTVFGIKKNAIDPKPLD
jgi:hypothetical protein